MLIDVIAGARPNFMKIAPIIKEKVFCFEKAHLSSVGNILMAVVNLRVAFYKICQRFPPDDFL